MCELRIGAGIAKQSPANPQHGTVSLSKYNLVNTFMGVSLSPSRILKLVVAVPMTFLHKGPLIAIPLVLPME